MSFQRRKPRATESGIARARSLRQEMTFPERKLWSMLRGGRLAGLKFRRQVPMPPYVADFYCAHASLVVELDGMSHVGTGAKDDDRTAHIEKVFNVKVIRFTNDEILHHEEAVLTAIARAAGVNW